MIKASWRYTSEWRRDVGSEELDKKESLGKWSFLSVNGSFSKDSLPVLDTKLKVPGFLFLR